MVANTAELVQLKLGDKRREAKRVFLEHAARELVFAVVGHIGSGTSLIADYLRELLEAQDVEVDILEARAEILAWAKEKNYQIPADTKTVKYVDTLQNWGDEMRENDHAAVALRLIQGIRLKRAQRQKQEAKNGEPVIPDGRKRAFILSSLRHPAEVELLRHIYGNAFALIGVVCQEGERKRRLGEDYYDAGGGNADDLMRRDAKDPKPNKKNGQRVLDTFHLSDYFIDNTVPRLLDKKTGESNPDWDVDRQLERLVKIVTHDLIIRPTAAETAIYTASGAQMRSACLSRQVGACLTDEHGNVIATGVNEVPKAGGGVYGSGQFDAMAHVAFEGRCALREGRKYCSNVEERNKIINELISDIPALGAATGEDRDKLVDMLISSRIGGLLEFSRAVHAEMDALLSAARKGASTVGARMFVTTLPCHYCARHIVSAGVDEVQYIEPYPKSKALELHHDSITYDPKEWKPPSESGRKVLFRPFTGVAPRLYVRAFLKDRDLKNDKTGQMQITEPDWGGPWYLAKASYVQLEAELSKDPVVVGETSKRESVE
jgi:deoxycytidylate deaminase